MRPRHADSLSVDGTSSADVNRYWEHRHWFSSVRAPACWHGSSSLPRASSRGANGKINDLLENNWLNLCCSLSGGGCASFLSCSMQQNSFSSSRSSFFTFFFIWYKTLRLQRRQDGRGGWRYDLMWKKRNKDQSGLKNGGDEPGVFGVEEEEKGRGNKSVKERKQRETDR